MNLQALLAGDQAVVRIGQIAVCRETHHVTRTGDGFQTRVALQGKAPPEYVLRQTVDSQWNKLPPFVTQQRRGIAIQHVAQRGDQPLKAVLMTIPVCSSMAIFASTSTEKLIAASLSF